MEKLAISGTPARPVVTVHVPASVLTQRESIDKVLGSILNHIGCAACHSGVDIRWKTIENYLVDEKLGVHGVVVGPEAGAFGG